MTRPRTTVRHYPDKGHDRGEDWREGASCKGAADGGASPWDHDAPTDDHIFAQMVCLNDCPVIAQCDAFARSIRPDGGVWAGHIIADRSHGNRTPKTQETTA